MNRPLIASATMGALLALAASASAQTPDAALAADQAAQAAVEQTAASDESQLPGRHCLQQTGSRITEARNARVGTSERRCAVAFGRVYSRADIDGTGAIDLADALRKLDPAIR
jgi:hypothetical protein